jgi:hypothetical protein
MGEILESSASFMIVLMLSGIAACGGYAEHRNSTGAMTTGWTAEDGDEPGLCYFETRTGFSCSDGQTEHGTWEAVCSDIAEESCAPVGDFEGLSNYVDGCTFESVYRNIEWMSPEDCEEKLSMSVLDPDGTECSYHEDCESGCCSGVCSPASVCEGGGDGDGDGDGDYLFLEVCGQAACGWDANATPAGYYCGFTGEDPDGNYPIDCPSGLVEGDACGVIDGAGCCDANGDNWYCALP